MGSIYTISPPRLGGPWTVIDSSDRSIRGFPTRSDAIQFANLKIRHDRSGSIQIHIAGSVEPKAEVAFS